MRQVRTIQRLPRWLSDDAYKCFLFVFSIPHPCTVFKSKELFSFVF